MSLESARDRKLASKAQAKEQDDLGIIQILENACFARQCRWRDCKAVLGSWEVLRKHIEKMHCEEFSSRQTSSSRPYRCCYRTCQNRIFSFAPLLLEHIVSSHLEQLKLRCPLGCNQNLTRIQSLVQHLNLVHDTTPYELRSAQIQRPSPRQEPLPELPTLVPTYLLAPPLVRPSPSFDPSKALAAAKKAAEAPKDEWSDFASLDISEGSAVKSFARLQVPEAYGKTLAPVRATPREFHKKHDDRLEESNQETEGLEESESDGPKVGYHYWKRRFKKEKNRQ